MAQRSPTIEGFRVLFRRPSLTLAEVAWHWSFWAAAVFLFGVLIVEYLDTLPVGARDLMFLDSGQPTLVGKALAHIFRGSGLRFVLGATIVLAGVALAWTLVSAVGRSACLRVIREYFAESSARKEHDEGGGRVRSLVGLNLLRLVVGLAAFIGAVGALVLPARLFARYHPQPGLLFVWTLLLLAMVSFAWSILNWTVSLAAIFVVRDGRDSFGALADAARFSRDRSGGLWAINIWFTLVHLTIFFIGTTIASTILGMAQLLPVGLVLTALLIVALLYFVIADSIHVGRMAAWFCLAETPIVPVNASSTIVPTTPGGQMAITPPPPQSSVVEFPPEDDILSEVESRGLPQPEPEGEN